MSTAFCSRCCRSGLTPDDPLLDQMATNLTDEDCKRIAELIVFYIQASKMQLSGETATIPINTVVSCIRAELDTSYNQNISLTEMARIYRYNEKYLGRLFKSQVGMTFGQYLNHTRLKQAAKLLRQGKDSVMEISQRVGFNNVTYFNRLFQRLHGLTPTAYRNAHRRSRGK